MMLPRLLSERHWTTLTSRLQSTGSRGQQAWNIYEGMYAGDRASRRSFLGPRSARLDGWQILVAISQDEQLRSIPVVVLSTSFRDSHK